MAAAEEEDAEEEGWGTVVADMVAAVDVDVDVDLRVGVDVDLRADVDVDAVEGERRV